MTWTIALALVGSIALLLFLVLAWRLHAFLALLIASIAFGIGAGVPPADIIDSIKSGMGGTLAAVATIIGLGAIFGALLEHTGGTQAVAKFLLGRLGEERAPLAFVLTGFFVAIPVFFDVAFILLVPLVYELGRRTGKSLLRFGIPLLAGLAATHAFIPPTPGPIIVASYVQANLGWVIGLGFVVGIPAVLVAGLWWGKQCGDRFFLAAPERTQVLTLDNPPPLTTIFALIALPILLILGNTLAQMGIDAAWWPRSTWTQIALFVGEPIIALLLATVLALWFLGTARGLERIELQKIATQALLPAGAIILITGAGGVFKQMLVNSEAGAALAGLFTNYALLPPLLAFSLAAVVRVIQGSATVAMATAGSLLAPAVAGLAISAPQTALLVLSVAAGASTLSHVNDSGFWLVKEYLGMDESTTLRTWTFMTLWLSLVALAVILPLYFLLS